jgi:exodeoxyribonuclease VII large subunit
MTWDLFASSAAARHESLARSVAASSRGALAIPRESWTVSAVNAAARELVESLFPPMWVAGEVTNFTRARSGHCYFSLRDADSQLRCVMWKDEARRLPTAPAEGMQVRALGRLSLYEPRGEFQLVVSDLDAKGDGLWKLAFDRLRIRLDGEGLLAPERKRPIPRQPRRVGLVTSASGAALRDVLAMIRRRAPWTEVVLCGCRVQGDGAAEEIAGAIRMFARARCADVLIVGRGGGSVEDLWAFNEEVVARALAESPVPTISAVGHETDFTIADLVADLRAPTPSAAAEAAVPERNALCRKARELALRLESSIQGRLAELRDAAEVERTALVEATYGLTRRHRERIAQEAGKLNALSPLAALGRGFAVPLDPGGRVLRSAGDFVPGASFRLQVVDGVVPCEVAR